MSAAILLPLVMAGAAGAAAIFTMQDDAKQKREMRRYMRRQSRPTAMTIPERCKRFRHRCHQYIDLTTLDRYDVQAKRRYLDLKLRDHIDRHIAPMLKARAPPRAISKKCVGICEKVADELHIIMKPRCEPPISRKYSTHADYATTIFSLDYNHAPAITNIGIGGKRSLM